MERSPERSSEDDRQRDRLPNGCISGRTKKKIRDTLDLLFSMLVLGPLTVLYWRGTFTYLTIVTFRSVKTLEDRALRAFVLFFMGLAVKIFLDVIKHIVYAYSDVISPTIIFIIKFFVLYFDCLFGVFMWVGGFNILYSGPDLHWYSLLSVLLVSSILLMMANGFQCTGGAPLILALDTNEDVFMPKSYFSSQLEEGTLWVVADTVFSYAVIHVLVICSWWGMWELENNYILEEMEIIVKDVQAWDSLLISFVLVMGVISANRYLKENISEERPMRMESNLVAWMGFLSAVNFWRGFWSILDFFFLPNIPLMENLMLSHITGFFLCFLLGASRSLTMSSHRDYRIPKFHSCRYFNIDFLEPDEAAQEARQPLLGESPA